jgi:ABC-2 type transport system ATP-binding protein
MANSDAAIRLLREALVVGDVETLGKVNGHIHIRALPRTGTLAASDVAALLRAQQIPIDELYVERGRLDEVFREITTSHDHGPVSSKSTVEGASDA